MDVGCNSNRSAVFSDSAIWRLLVVEFSVVQFSVPATQQPPVIRHCFTHHPTGNDKDCWKVCDSITDDRWLLSSGVRKLNNFPRTNPCQNCLNYQVSDFGHSGFTQLGNRSGAIIKCKAGICLRGDSVIDDSETHTPAVQWSAVRFFFIILICL